MHDEHEQYKRVGILGGMGPAATIRLYEEITSRTPARGDQDHIPLIIDSQPRTPDRTAALLQGGEDPLPHLLQAVRRLEAAGADFLAIACNTAHAWYQPIAAAASVPVLHLIALTAGAACRAADGGAVGVLATSGTVASGLYQNELSHLGGRPLLTDEKESAEVMRAIYLVKQGGHANLQEATRTMRTQAAGLIDRGARSIILGCTDISVIVRHGDLPVPVVDSTVVLAERIIAVARGDANPEECG